MLCVRTVNLSTGSPCFEGKDATVFDEMEFIWNRKLCIALVRLNA